MIVRCSGALRGICKLDNCIHYDWHEVDEDSCLKKHVLIVKVIVLVLIVWKNYLLL